MMIVGEIDEVFLPSPDDLLVNLAVGSVRGSLGGGAERESVRDR